MRDYTRTPSAVSLSLDIPNLSYFRQLLADSEPEKFWAHSLAELGVYCKQISRELRDVQVGMAILH